VATYDLQPQMSAPEVSDRVVEGIRSGDYDFIALNYANPDMVGHTGILEAAIAAVEEIDLGLGRILEADRCGGRHTSRHRRHGNCEQMIDPKTGEPHTAHTLNPVPCILYGRSAEGAKLRDGGRLADVAPTLLDLLDLPQPDAMTGISLLGAAPQQVDLLDESFTAQASQDSSVADGNAALSAIERERAQELLSAVSGN
jgi:2,3-bisphosphoglycerate-independent phosphoglycerate mutase